MRKYYPQAEQGRRIEIGRFVIDAAEHVARIDERAVELSQREFELALMLFENVGRIVSKDALIKRIWGGVDRRYDATLATYVSKLRSALELRSHNGLVISTIYNHGYRLERV